MPEWPSLARVQLRQGRAKPVWAAHPWVYSGAIEDLRPPISGLRAEDGSVLPGWGAAVFDQLGRYLGVGYVHPRSQIALRLMTFSRDGIAPARAPDLAAITRAHIGNAVARRRDLGLPSADTDTYRLVNAEGDALPGLSVDVLGRGVVVQVTTQGMARLETVITTALEDTIAPEWIVVRTPDDVDVAEGLPPALRVTRGELPERIELTENGVRYVVDVKGGQKTGFFCDQRDNRALVARLAKGRFVLDCYAYLGGFGFNAARGGAREVVCVEASQRAVECMEAGIALNGMDNITALREDAVLALRRYAERPESERPDLVVIDPPKFARSASSRDAAIQKYIHTNTIAMHALRPGGWLVTCSCSGHVNAEDFHRIVAEAAYQAGRVLHATHALGAGPDHPVLPAHAEGRYLKVLVGQVESR